MKPQISLRTARSVWTATGLPALSTKSGSKLRALQTLRENRSALWLSITISLAGCLGLTLLCSSTAFADDLTPRPTMGEILRLDPSVDAWLAPDVRIEVLAS